MDMNITKWGHIQSKHKYVSIPNIEINRMLLFKKGIQI